MSSETKHEKDDAMENRSTSASRGLMYIHQGFAQKGVIGLVIKISTVQV